MASPQILGLVMIAAIAFLAVGVVRQGLRSKARFDRLLSIVALAVIATIVLSMWH